MITMEVSTTLNSPQVIVIAPVPFNLEQEVMKALAELTRVQNRLRELDDIEQLISIFNHNKINDKPNWTMFAIPDFRRLFVKGWIDEQFKLTREGMDKIKGWVTE